MLSCRVKRFIVAGAIAAALFAALHSPARATLIQSFQTTGGNPNLMGSGFFEFDQPAGTFDTNLVAFEFAGTLFGLPFSFSLGSTAFPLFEPYTIDPSGVLSFTSVVNSNAAFILEPFLLAVGMRFTPTSVRLGCIDQLNQDRCGGFDTTNETASLTFVQAPEPSTALTLGSGLLALAWLRRRRSDQKYR